MTTTKNSSLFRLEILPFLIRFSLLVGMTLLGDFFLHSLNLAGIGRHLGIPGTIIIVLSLMYSLRKRKFITKGNPRLFLRLHEILTWLGTLMVFIHAGVHFNAVLPWLATLAMMINIISGMVGRYLLSRSQRRLMALKEDYQLRGLSNKAVETELFWDAVTYDLMASWRAVHYPISFAFAVLALGHIFTVFLFWGWR